MKLHQRSIWFVGAYSTLITIIVLGLYNSVHHSLPTASHVTSPAWLFIPGGLLVTLIGCHALIEYQRIGAALDAYHDESFFHRVHIAGEVEVVVVGVFFAGLGVPLTIIGIILTIKALI